MRGWSDRIIPLAAASLALVGGERAHGATDRTPAARPRRRARTRSVPEPGWTRSGTGSPMSVPSG
jgi:hypothetical protein